MADDNALVQFSSGLIKDGDAVRGDKGAVGTAGAVVRLEDDDLAVLAAGHVATEHDRLKMQTPDGEVSVELKRIIPSLVGSEKEPLRSQWFREEHLCEPDARIELFSYVRLAKGGDSMLPTTTLEPGLDCYMFMKSVMERTGDIAKGLAQRFQSVPSWYSSWVHCSA